MTRSARFTLPLAAFLLLAAAFLCRCEHVTLEGNKPAATLLPPIADELPPATDLTASEQQLVGTYDEILGTEAETWHYAFFASRKGVFFVSKELYTEKIVYYKEITWSATPTALTLRTKAGETNTIAYSLSGDTLRLATAVPTVLLKRKK